MLCQIAASKPDWVAENMEHSGRLIVLNTVTGRAWNLTRLPEDQESWPWTCCTGETDTHYSRDWQRRSEVSCASAGRLGWCGWAAQTKHTHTRISGAKHLQLQLLQAWKHACDLEKYACNGAADITGIPEKPAACSNTSASDTEKHLITWGMCEMTGVWEFRSQTFSWKHRQ